MFDFITTNNCLLLEHLDGIILACCLVATQVDLEGEMEEGGRREGEGGREEEREEKEKGRRERRRGKKEREAKEEKE